MFKKILLVGTVIAITGAGYWAFSNQDKVDNQGDQQMQTANPASVYCLEQGGSVDIRNFSDGQRGFCVFDDGSECDEWKFFRGECEKGDNTCKDLCGDGVCQEIVCMGSGCPCPETFDSCPQDCN